jgi:hypothetical protein
MTQLSQEVLNRTLKPSRIPTVGGRRPPDPDFAFQNAFGATEQLHTAVLRSSHTDTKTGSAAAALPSRVGPSLRKFRAAVQTHYRDELYRDELFANFARDIARPFNDTNVQSSRRSSWAHWSHRPWRPSYPGWSDGPCWPSDPRWSHRPDWPSCSSWSCWSY